MGLDASIGLSALLAAQRGLDVVGNNIANASTPGYTRESLRLAEAPAVGNDARTVGGGVLVRSIERISDLFLDGRIRDASATSSADTAEASRLDELSSLVGATGPGSLADLVSQLASSAQALAARPDDAATRGLVVARASALAQGFQRTTRSLDATAADIADEIKGRLGEANGLARQVAALNREILDVKARGGSPNALLDERDQVAGQLSDLVGAQGQPAADGTLDLAVGGQLIVAGARSTDLEPVADANGTPSVRLVGTTQTVNVASGSVGGLLSVARDAIPALASRLDQLAAGIMRQANRANATGLTASGPLTTLTTSIAVRDVNRTGDPTDDRLAAAGLPTTPAAGTISVNVTQLATGATSTVRIAFDPSRQSLRDLASALGGVANLSASAGSDGRLTVSAASGYAFDFADRTGAGASDQGGVLASLGVQSFFTGTGARDMQVAAPILASSSGVAAGAGPGSGDGRNAAALAGGAIDSLGGASATSFLANAVADIGLAAQGAQSRADGSGQALASLQDARQSVSGVSTEEEVAKMIQFQHSFQAASRYLSVLNTLAQDLLRVVGG